jgi:hypothetical protein
MENNKELPKVKGEFHKPNLRSHPGRFYSKEVFDKAALAWQKEQMIDIQGMIRQKADEIATKWEMEEIARKEKESWEKVAAMPAVQAVLPKIDIKAVLSK